MESLDDHALDRAENSVLNKRSASPGVETAVAVKRGKTGHDLHCLSALLNPLYCSPAWKEETRSGFAAATPFPHAFWQDFFNHDLISGVTEEIKTIPYSKKNNDLYFFYQSGDLKSIESAHISTLKELLYSDAMRKWISDVTGIGELTSEVDMFASRYVDKSTLLCHDDQLEGRLVAFIIYLVPKDWNEADGGSLALFSTDSHNHPRELVKVISPRWNSFLCFEVSNKSYHQVCEVVSSEKERVAIGGWFHGKREAPLPPTLPPAPLPTCQVGTGESVALAEWINPLYLDEENLMKMRDVFAEDSTLELAEFIKVDVYSDLVEELHDQSWRLSGPANYRHYHEIIPPCWCDPSLLSDTPTGLVEQYWALFASSEFAAWLMAITQLDFLEFRGKVRRMSPGSYALSQDVLAEENALDLTMCCSTGEIPPEDGGFLGYMDEEQLLASSPCQANLLNLTYRDAGTMRFTKYLSHHCRQIRFDYELSFPIAAGSSEEEEEEPSLGIAGD